MSIKRIFLYRFLTVSVEYFSPGQLHWFEYQTPIQSSSVGLFELHHAVRGRWAAESNRSWMYWVKILMEWSQSPSRLQPSARENSVWMRLDRALTNASMFLPKKLVKFGARGCKHGPHGDGNDQGRDLNAPLWFKRPTNATPLAVNNCFLVKIIS